VGSIQGKLVRTDKSTLSGRKDGLGVHGAHTALLFRKPSVQSAPFRHPSSLHPKLLGSDQQNRFLNPAQERKSVLKSEFGEQSRVFFSKTKKEKKARTGEKEC